MQAKVSNRHGNESDPSWKYIGSPHRHQELPTNIQATSISSKGLSLNWTSEGYAEDYVASNSRVAELFHFGLSW